MDEVQQSGIILYKEKYSPIWMISKKGNYSIREAINWLSNDTKEEHTELWKRVWKNV